MDFKTVELKEKDFRELVLRSHKEGNFRGDPHKMYANFKLHKNSFDFKSISYENQSGEVVAFCGVDVFKTSSGETKGMIHCQGVIQKFRGKGLSVKILKELEDYLPEETTEILSICNPISSGAHQKAGYEVTNPGRITKSGKRAQIRLRKKLK